MIWNDHHIGAQIYFAINEYTVIRDTVTAINITKGADGKEIISYRTEHGWTRDQGDVHREANSAFYALDRKAEAKRLADEAAQADPVALTLPLPESLAAMLAEAPAPAPALPAPSVAELKAEADEIS